MSGAMPTDAFARLLPSAARIAERLKARQQTVAVAESSSGGLLSAALLAVPGASAYFLGSMVVYTQQARLLLGVSQEAMTGLRSASEPYALLLADTVRERFGTVWALAETGAAGPAGNRYGDAPGHSCIAITGPARLARTLETGSADRVDNMGAFAEAVLAAFAALLDAAA